eukprot:jgi/Astpho2/725/e_gw1.00015.18.1_t
MPLYVLKSSAGVEVHVRPIGCCIQRLLVPDAQGNLEDIVLGFDDLKPYSVRVGTGAHVFQDGTSPYFGVLVGRCANRIEGATFALNGTVYRVPANDGRNSLHGGIKGFDKHIWDSKQIEHPDGEAVRLTRTSPDGEEGYPGTVQVAVTYVLTGQGTLKLMVEATTDKGTIINPAQHSYFNMAGHASGTILEHQLTINGDHYTPKDSESIPTGEILPVKGTPFDFGSPHSIGSRLSQVPGGYDHNFVLQGLGKQAKFKMAAKLRDPDSGRTMTISTTAPGLQFYSGNFLSHGGQPDGKSGAEYSKYSGLALETQNFPNAVNQPAFPSVTLSPGESYRQETW